MATTPTQPGLYTFLDAIGGPPQRIEVVENDGELLARFPPADGDEGMDVPVADMLGDFSPAA